MIKEKWTMKTKIFCILITLFMVIIILPIAAFADTKAANTYTYNNYNVADYWGDNQNLFLGVSKTVSQLSA